jgi:hypothetical protein
LIRNIFLEFKVGPDNNIEQTAPLIIDVFNINSELLYNLDNYENWGYLLNLDTVKNRAKDFKVSPEELAAITKTLQDYYDNFDETSNINAIIEKYAKEDTDIIKFEEWATL